MPIDRIVDKWKDAGGGKCRIRQSTSRSGSWNERQAYPLLQPCWPGPHTCSTRVGLFDIGFVFFDELFEHVGARIGKHHGTFRHQQLLQVAVGLDQINEINRPCMASAVFKKRLSEFFKFLCFWTSNRAWPGSK
jgi:hypothetical protein